MHIHGKDPVIRDGGHHHHHHKHEKDKLVDDREDFSKNPFKAIVGYLFPHLHLFSITVAFALLCVIAYVIELLVHSRHDWPCTLYKCGGWFFPAVKYHFHIHRFVVPAFLHMGVWHLLWNVLIFLIIGNSSEHFFGPRNFGIMLLLSAIGGNLFSAAFGNACALLVGAETCIMGIIGFFVVLFFTVYRELGSSKYVYTIVMVILLALLIAGGFYNSGGEVDAWGRLGGLLIGFCYALTFYAVEMKHSLVRPLRVGAGIALVVLFGVAAGIAFSKETRMCPAFVC